MVVVYRHCASWRLPTEPEPISLFLDIGQGAGLAGATGVRPFLPPLLGGALARGDIGLDFEGTDYSFLESPVFLAAVLALAVAAYAAGRLRARATAPVEPTGGGGSARPAGARAEGADPLATALAVLAVGLGALLFAGSLAGEGHTGWPGLIVGAACAALGYAAGAAIFGRARRRLDASAAALLPLWADAAALSLAALAILLPPVGLLALVAFAWLLLASRREQSRKYGGLRILR